MPAAGRVGLLQPVRRARASPCSRRPPSAGWACRRSSRPATAPTCRATTCCSTGRPIPPRTSCCCTWSRSATRASSPGLARRLARTKPIVAVKSGRWTETRRRRRPLLAPVDESRVQALFEHSGVIRVQNVTQMFDTALLLAYQPLPAGGRVAVVGNSTALNLLVVDALHGEDLVLAGDPVDAGHDREPRGPGRRGRRGRPVRRRRRAGGGVRPTAGDVRHGARRGAARGGGRVGQAGGHHVPRHPGDARRARRAAVLGPRRRARPRVGAQLPDARAGRRRARDGRCATPAGAPHRPARPSGPPGSTCRTRGRSSSGTRASASTCSTTTSASRCCAATASRCCRSGGWAARREAVAAASELGFPVAIKADRRAVAAPGRRRRACG